MRLWTEGDAIVKNFLLAAAAIATAAPAFSMPAGAGFLPEYYLTQGECQQVAGGLRREGRSVNGDWFFVCLYDEQSDAWRLWTNSRKYYH